jgi:hypothetical protein
MDLFKNIRLKIGKITLKNKLEHSKRKVFYSNISHVKKIGIVWDASKPTEFACLTRFYQKMHERKIDVSIIGYFPANELPDQYTAIRFLTCLKKQEINSFYHPLSSESNSFINTRFDILIDVNFNKEFPLYYISSLSNAAFKVGLWDSESKDIFDLMMEIKKPVDLDNYLDQVIEYLTMINSGPVKQFTN